MKKMPIIIVSLSLAMAVVLSGCLTVKLPGSQESPPEEVAPPEERAPRLTVIEVPSEAHIGEYITVKLRIPKHLDPKIFDEYTLRICNERSIGLNCYDLGYARPDQDRIVCWYVAIPYRGIGNMYTNAEHTEWDDITRPGVFKLEVDAPLRPPYEEGDYKRMFERNIIIKD